MMSLRRDGRWAGSDVMVSSPGSVTSTSLPIDAVARSVGGRVSSTLSRIDAPAAPRRPAHRPSRRQVVIDGAMGLFATMPVDEVTVQDIASAVEMTPAAVYYHFASKEQILTEGMQHFADQMLAEIRAQLPTRDGAAGLDDLITHVIAWTARRRAQAIVYFVNSIGLNLVVEALRRAGKLRDDPEVG